MAITGTIRVDFQIMQNEASNFAGLAQEVQSNTNSMMQSVESMNGQWVGDAGTSYIKKFQQLQQDMQEMYRIISEYVVDLLNMIRNYQQAESEIQSQVGGLETDVIQF